MMIKRLAILASCLTLASCATMPRSLPSGVTALATAQDEQTEIVAAATAAQYKAADTQAQAAGLEQELAEAAPEIQTKAAALVETAAAAAQATKEVTAKLFVQTKTLAEAQAQAAAVATERDQAKETVAKDEVKIVKRAGWIVGLAAVLAVIIIGIVAYVIIRIKSGWVTSLLKSIK